MPRRKKLTERTVKSETEPGLVWDTDISGFGLRVLAGKSGITRSFVLNYRAGGRERRMTIGRYPAWSAQAAREAAIKYKRRVDAGGDPLAERQAADGASTVADVWEQYEADHLPDKRESSRRGDQDSWERYIKPAIGRMKATAVKKADIQAMHRKIKQRAPYQANRVLALVSKLFNFARAEMELPVENPAKGVKKAPEQARKRYLTKAETERLLAVLDQYPVTAYHRLPKSKWFEHDGRIIKSRTVKLDEPDPALLQSVNVIKLIMLTGCRKGEALAAKWEQFNLEAGTWTKPAATTKQEQEHQAPLSRHAIELLNGIKRTGSPYVFPGDEGHQQDIKKAWATIRRRAGIEDVRIHDLRHQFASVLVSAGQSLAIIGALLGHTQSKTTERYAHLFDEPLRKATDAAGAVLSGKPKADVHNIRETRK